MAYNPESPADRRALAIALEAAFAKAKFTLISNGDTEDVYEFEIPQVPGTRIKVYSSIKDGAVRAVGADAIRVVLTYKRKRDGREMPISKETRVHRTGEISAIVERTLERMRGSWNTMKERHNAHLQCRHCGAPLFTARSGKDVCAETCWEK